MRLSTAQRLLAEQIGYRVPRSTLYRWCASGLICATRIERHLFISAQALAAFLALRTEEGPRDFAHLPNELRQQAEENNRAIFAALENPNAETTAPGETL